MYFCLSNHKAAQSILDKLPSAAEQCDSKGQNFLHVAIKKGDMESALFLLTVNVDVNSRVQDNLLTPPLHLAARYGNETLVRSLILAGARVNNVFNLIEDFHVMFAIIKCIFQFF